MNTLLLTVHVIACISLVVLVLLQSGHEGMGVIFGGSSSSLFGSSGAGGLLSKLTVSMAIVFFVTSLTFTYIDSQKKSAAPPSVVLEKSETQKQSAPGQVDTKQVPPAETGKKSSGQGE